MGKITPKCAGCVWVTEALAPECKTCVNNNHYSYRKHNFGVEKEMSMVKIEPVNTSIPLGTSTDKMNMVSYITKKLRVIADDLGLELYPTTRLSKGELWVVFYNPDSHRARKVEIKLDEFVDEEETYDMIRGFLVREGLSNGLGYKYDTAIASRYIATHNPYLDVCELYPRHFGLKEKEKEMRLPKIEKVIFNDPATIVIWKDGSKTVVKSENEFFDAEKGLAMAISKKALGNEGNYYEEFKKWLPKDEISMSEFMYAVSEHINEIMEHLVSIGEENTEEEPDTCDCCGGCNACGKVDTSDPKYFEILAYGGNKSKCNGNCSECCPVDRNNKKYAGKACKEKCYIYAEHFNN